MSLPLDFQMNLSLHLQVLSHTYNYASANPSSSATSSLTQLVFIYTPPPYIHTVYTANSCLHE